MTSNRSDKVADLLKKEISLIITNEIKDIRLQNINITAVKVSDDIGIATVFYTVIGESIHKEESKIDKKLDSCLEIISSLFPSLEGKYKKFYKYSTDLEWGNLL